jgi:hypothetical protein
VRDDGDAVGSTAVLSASVLNPASGVRSGEGCGDEVPHLRFVVVCPAAPLVEGVDVGVRVGIVPLAARASNASCSSLGRLRPRFDARRRMPTAARADRENRGGALGSKMSVSVVWIASQTKDEDSSSALGHSEELSVENPKRPPIPEVPQSTDERRHVSPAMTGQESRDVFEEHGGRSVSLHKGEEREGEDASLSGEPGSLSGDAEVLAREAGGPKISTAVRLVCPVPLNVGLYGVVAPSRLA